MIDTRSSFDPDCCACPRLSDFLQQIRREYPDYHARPVAPFGDPKARLLIVGLAPGMHGANASGRPFTGDYAGILLYETLHRFGFSSAPVSRSKNDGLQLFNCRITNAVKCLPPQNKPLGREITACNTFLKRELSALSKGSLVVALGGVAHRSVLKALDLRVSHYPFAHGAQHSLNERLHLIDSYHCSRYNTQTKRLTPEMFYRIFELARSQLE